jgi:single-stranded-DNA-specific exonuclease
MPPAIVTRPFPAAAASALAQAGVPTVLARVLAARGVRERGELEYPLKALLPYTALKNIDAAAAILADAIEQQKRLLIVGDYDADGATATAVGMRAFGAMGARIDYLVPNRFDYGYGLTPEIVQVAAQRAPDLIITVDNGIASINGVAEATRLGIGTIVTDHHIAGPVLPDALSIVNPNQPGCAFASKALAGVGVMFYVVLATRAALRQRGYFSGARREPNVAALLDLVALGTIADVVKLDANNRLLVEQGMRRIRAGRACVGIHALLQVAGRPPSMATSYDLGFLLGPRLNAAGRLQDISLGIECLLTDDAARALDIARQLDQLNRERRSIEADMQDAALVRLDRFDAGESFSITLFEPDWHQGVVGLVASRIKDRFHRPVIALARGSNGELKGSGRSIPALHLRDALDLVDKRAPGLLLRFGGHAAAAGVALREEDLPAFAAAFESVVRELLSPVDLERTIETDGSLQDAEIDIQLARRMHEHAWGQGFPAPTFHDVFAVIDQRIVGEKHSRLKLRRVNSSLSSPKALDAILFGYAQPLPARIEAVYRLGLNFHNDSYGLELAIEHWQTVL